MDEKSYNVAHFILFHMIFYKKYFAVFI